MKKQYKKPLTCELLVKSESLLYVTSIDYGGDGNDPGAPTDVDAKEFGIWDWDDEWNEDSADNLWDDREPDFL